MLKNYLLLALRNLLKYKLYSFINITGLAIGIAFLILIYLHVDYEHSYDSFHKDINNLYRLYYQMEEPSDHEGDSHFMGMPKDGTTVKFTYLPYPLANTLVEEVPGIEMSSMFIGNNGIYRYGDKAFKEDITYVRKDFFKMFSFPLIKGTPETVFEQLNSVVITKDMVEQYFPEEDPYGKTISIETADTNRLFTITGIIETPPANSIFEFKFLLPVESNPRYDFFMSKWNAFNGSVFIKTDDNADLLVLEEKLKTISDKYLTEHVQHYRERYKYDDDYEFFWLKAEPLRDAYLNDEIQWFKSSSPVYSYILSGIGLIILFIAASNFITLALTGVSSRNREIGIRKVCGAGKKQVAMQLYVETQVIVVISLLLALVFVEIVLPYFNQFTGSAISFNLFGRPSLFIPILLIAIIIGLISGGIPAIVMSRQKPILSLKQGVSFSLFPNFAKVIVLFQFILFSFMISASLIMSEQMRYITEKDLGFDKEHLIAIRTMTGTDEEGEKLLEEFRTQMANETGIQGITGTSTSFGQGWSATWFSINDKTMSTYLYRIDTAYASVLGLEIVQGSDFSEAQLSDMNSACLINESFRDELGIENPVGEILPIDDDFQPQVIGVVKDYHFLNLKQKIGPVCLFPNPVRGSINNIIIKVDKGSYQSTIDHISDVWKKIAPGKPFQWSFVEDDLNRKYEKTANWLSIMSYSTGFAVFIACLGLFGLSGIQTVRKAKEIGIRKVLGASVNSILLLLNKNILILILLALPVSIPISWYIMGEWLSAFTYKIEPDFGIYLITGAIGIFITVATISYHSIISAIANPVDVIRDE